MSSSDHHLFLRAFGAVTSSTPTDQLEAVRELLSKLKVLELDLCNKARVEHAHVNASQRLQPGDPSYMVHMRHCYGLDFDDFGQHEGHRFSCKYGEDEICPAALFEDPWAEYVRLEDESKK